MKVQQPRCRKKTKDQFVAKFSSRILTPYLRRTRSIEDVIPWLYLKDVSTGDFQEALAALLGDQAAGFSSTTITRLNSVWKNEYDDWQRRSLKDRRYVYIWADGVYFNVRLGEDDRNCILVIKGTTTDGEKELLAVMEGRRCWAHKTANVLDKLPKSMQPRAKKMLHEIYNRTTNPIESTFATVRLRTNKTKGCGSGTATLLMVFKLAQSAQKNWRRLRGYERLADVIDIR